MSDRTFIVLGDSPQLVRELRGALPGARIIETGCLDHIPPLTDLSHARVLVVHGTVPRCCIEKLDRWIVDSSPIRGEIRAFRPRKAIKPKLRSASDAWRDRAYLLSPRSDKPGVRAFIAAAESHDHEWFTVHEAAYSMGISVRQIRRIIEKETGYSPHVLLHLARIVSIAKEIQTTNKPLKELAESHQFADLSSMSRQFKRFVGHSPGEYRRRTPRSHDRIGQDRMAERVD
jgi:AraC-like DNA-binding protein